MLSIHPKVNINHDIDRRNENLRRDEDDHYHIWPSSQSVGQSVSQSVSFPIHFFFSRQKKQKITDGVTLTNPLQILSMRMSQLILQDRQKVSNDIQSLRQQSRPLIHLQIRSDGLVDGIELWFGPHDFW